MNEKSMDFGKERVSVLFGKMFFPTVFGMLCISAVTTIDGIFIGHGVGSDGIAAVNICIPLLMVLTGIGLMMGVGSSVTASIYLARGKTIAARASITQTMLTVTAIGVAVTIVLVAFPAQVARMLGSSEHLLPMVKDYLTWFSLSLLFELWLAVAQFALRLDGAPKTAMYCSITASVANAVLDWLFIFPLDMGVKGAAIATSVACMIGAGIAVAYMLFFAKTLRLNLHKLLPCGKRLVFYCRETAEQCRIGASALLGESTMAMLMFLGNHVFMLRLGDNGVGAFGISCYYLPFVFMIGNAIAQSAQPIISFNHGAGNMGRIREALRISVFAAVVCGVVSVAAFAFVPELLVALFVDTNNPAAQIAIAGFPSYCTGFVFFITNITIIGYFQSVERVKPATVFALLRGIVFLMPCFFVLPAMLGTEGIWLSMPFSEFATTVAIIVFFVASGKMCRRTNSR